jgi:hypothetical protein
LWELRERGSVRNMHARRKDLYQLFWRGGKENLTIQED